MSRPVVIVEACRTPIGRGHRERGVLRDIHPATLLGHVLKALIERSRIDPAAVDDVIGGCVDQFGEQGINVTRNAWLEAGLPLEVPATTVDRQCGSSQQALNFAAAMVASGAQDVVVACGVEHMGRVSFVDLAATQEQFGKAFSSRLLERYSLVSQGLAAELIAERWQVGRERLDALALESHRRAAAAADGGRFAREIVPVPVGDELVTADQGVRRDTSAEALAALKPAFKEGGVITAGNSSQISDGAAAVLLMSEQRARELGVRARARVVDHVAVGVDPVTMLTGPIPATRKLLERNGLTLDDIDLVEINEAFASVVEIWRLELGADMERVNVNGGAIALGHPLGASGVRLVTTLLHELERRGGRLGLVTMCCLGGLGTATLIERLDDTKGATA